MVNVMVGLFQEDARYCIGIVPEWLPVCSAAKEGTLTKNELALHCHIVVCKNSCTFFCILLFDRLGVLSDK